MKKRPKVTEEQIIIKDMIDVAQKFYRQTGKWNVNRKFFRKNTKINQGAFEQIGWTYEDLLYNSIGDKLQNRGGIHRDSIDISKEYSKYPQVYLLTSVVPTFLINRKMEASVNNFIKHRRAIPQYLAMPGVHKSHKYSDEFFEDYGEHLITEALFNNNLKAMDMSVNPQQIKPLTGLIRLGQRGHSVIIASTKQQFIPAPVSNSKFPHILWSTGTMCDPSYAKNRQGRLANQDHLLGGLIVEVVSPTRFNVRPFQVDEDGTFYDLRWKYTPKGVTEEGPEVLVCGDIHSGRHDQQALNVIVDQIKYLGIKTVVLHDLFDGSSISHHTQNDQRARVNLPPHLKTLENELHEVGKVLTFIRSKCPKVKIVVVRSNHDEHLDRYISEGRFIKDDHNVLVAADLLKFSFKKLNPIQMWVEQNYPKLENIVWLTRKDSFKIAGIELGSHGDKGSKGKAAGIEDIERSYGRASVGHAHTPQVLRGVYVAGSTMPADNAPYTEGSANSWLPANISHYRNGMRQMLIHVEGNYHL